MTRERHHVALPAFQFGALVQVQAHHLIEDIERDGDIGPFMAAEAVDQHAPHARIDHQALEAFDCTSAHSKSPRHNHYHTDANPTRIRYPVWVSPTLDAGDYSRTLPRAIDSQRIESISTYARRGSAGVRSGSSVFCMRSGLPRLAWGGESRDENNLDKPCLRGVVVAGSARWRSAFRGVSPAASRIAARSSGAAVTCPGTQFQFRATGSGLSARPPKWWAGRTPIPS